MSIHLRKCFYSFLFCWDIQIIIFSLLFYTCLLSDFNGISIRLIFKYKQCMACSAQNPTIDVHQVLNKLQMSYCILHHFIWPHPAPPSSTVMASSLSQHVYTGQFAFPRAQASCHMLHVTLQLVFTLGFSFPGSSLVMLVTSLRLPLEHDLLENSFITPFIICSKRRG